MPAPYADDGDAPSFATHHLATLAAGQPATAPDIIVREDDPCILMYTSGTTGRPKGVVHTHRSKLFHNAMMHQAMGLTREDVGLSVAPLNHTAELHTGFLPRLQLGATQVLQRRFDAGEAWQLVEAERVTHFFAAPTMVGMLPNPRPPPGLRFQDFRAAQAPDWRIETSGDPENPCSARGHASLARISYSYDINFELCRYMVRESPKRRAPDVAPAQPEIDVDAIHKALANPVRRNILAWLRTPEAYFAEQEHPLDMGVCAGLIDAHCGLSQSTVSAHLATLQRAGLIRARRIGQWVFFKRDEETIQAFLDHIHQDL